MISILDVAQYVRHTPALEKADWFWNMLRKPYHHLLNLRGQGARVSIGGCCAVCIPPEFTCSYWEAYEPETVRATVDWTKKNTTGLVLDVGCSMGIFSIVGLSVSEQAQVVAFDADLSSLKATQRMCQYAKGDRLRLIYGLVSNQHLSSLRLNIAYQKTLEALSNSGVTGDPGTTAYVCIEGNENSSVPIHSLDGLLLNENLVKRPVLIKCDVEGAELLVLEGAKQLLERYRSSPYFLVL